VALHRKGSVSQVVTSLCNVVVEENVADRRIHVKVDTSFLWHCTARVPCRTCVTSSCNVVVEENVADRRIGVKVGTSFLCTAPQGFCVASGDIFVQCRC